MQSKLKDLPISQIFPNPENPRIVFRQEELDSLLISIKRFGLQVPISVYQEGDKYFLIDGERRWRTCKKLNLPTIPALVQEKPNELNNLLMMFNIHALREQWDPFTIANKITKIVDLLSVQLGRTPNEIELSEETGLTRGQIRRCRLLIDLPERFKDRILDELQKPKLKQRLSEDFFIEMEASLKTVKNHVPELFMDQDIDDVRDILIKKYETDIITNIVDFRKIAKLATAHKNLQYSVDNSKQALAQIFGDNTYSIDEVYTSTVRELYDDKKLVLSFHNTMQYISNLTVNERNDENIIRTLIELREAIDNILDED